MRLHGYFRSSAAWRVRIALHLKGLTVENRYQHLRTGQQLSPEYMAVNPQGPEELAEIVRQQRTATARLADILGIKAKE